MQFPTHQGQVDPSGQPVFWREDRHAPLEQRFGLLPAVHFHIERRGIDQECATHNRFGILEPGSRLFEQRVGLIKLAGSQVEQGPTERVQTLRWGGLEMMGHRQIRLHRHLVLVRDRVRPTERQQAGRT